MQHSATVDFTQSPTNQLLVDILPTLNGED